MSICQQLRKKCALCPEIGNLCPFSAEEERPHDSELAAAVAAFEIIAGCQQRCEREYGGVIYQSLGDEKWRFTGPFIGEPHKAPPLGVGNLDTARYHSHHTCGTGESFSEHRDPKDPTKRRGDIANAKELGVRSYLFTPSNQILMYDPETDKVMRRKQPLEAKPCPCQ